MERISKHLIQSSAKKNATFLAADMPFFVDRAATALAADPRVLEKSDGLGTSWGLAEEYGFTHIDGSRPDLGEHFDFEELFEKSSFDWHIRLCCAT